VPEALTSRFLAALRPVKAPPVKPHRVDCRCRTCAPRPTMDDQEFAEFAMRVVRAFEARVIDNPELLPAARVLADRSAEVINVAIAINADRYKVDPRSGVSMLECSRILKIDPAAASRRRARGVVTMGERIDRAGAAKFAEAKREREELLTARERAVDELAAYRARRAS
jgi:hypothetical protein